MLLSLSRWYRSRFPPKVPAKISPTFARYLPSHDISHLLSGDPRGLIAIGTFFYYIIFVRNIGPPPAAPRSMMQNPHPTPPIVLKRLALGRKSGKVNLQGCNLREVPRELWRFATLRPASLGASSTSANDEQDRWWELEPLTFLDLSNNAITSAVWPVDLVDDRPHAITAASGTHGRRNASAATPTFEETFSHATHVRLANNALTAIDPRFFGLPHLIELDLRRNDLSTLDEIPSASASTHATGTSSSNNNDDDEEWVWGGYERRRELQQQRQQRPARPLELLNLSYNAKLARLPLSFSTLSVLRQLNVSYCSLEVLEPSLVSSLPLLRSLVLSHNRLTSLPAQVFHLEHLETLEADNNLIEQLVEHPHLPDPSPAKPSWSSSLTVINLRSNRLTTIPATCLERCTAAKEVRAVTPLSPSPVPYWLTNTNDDACTAAARLQLADRHP